LGCVYYEDDIPEETFQQILPQSRVVPPIDDDIVDLEDVMLQREKGEGLIALIITPTRELALQVKDHISAVCKYTRIKVDMSSGNTQPSS